MKISIEIDIEDQDQLEMYVMAPKLLWALNDIKQTIRSRLKYGEGISEAEEKTLEYLRSKCFIDGLEI